MDLSWTSEQQAFFATIEPLAAWTNDGVAARDRDGVFNRPAWDKLGSLQLPGLAVPVEFGGLGHDPVTTVGALERLGYVCQDNGLTFSLNAHMWTACAPLAAFGTAGQRARYLPRLCRGEWIGGNAMTEPEGGSDAYALATTAVRTADGYRLNGRKTFVTNGPVADLLIVFATTDPAKGAAGVAAFIVERSRPGFSVVRTLDKMGLRTSPTAEIELRDCLVPEENRLGGEGAGASLFTHAMTWERGCILASAVGSMQRLLEVCIRRAKSRRQFGQPIGKFQQIGGKLVDMKLRLETARALLYQSAWQRKLGRTAVLEAALAKLHISESWVQSCEDALQLHGGSGYLTETGIERELRDAIASRIYSGTNEIQRNLVASLLT